MDINRAVITAAGREQRSLPLQTLVDQDGTTKAALQIVLEEAIEAGIHEIAVVVQEGDQPAYTAAAGPHASRIAFVVQKEQRGYGHAIHCAKSFCGDQPFLLLVGDHLYVSRSQRRCSQQLLQLAKTQHCSISAVNPTHESKLPYYGAVGGRLVPNSKELYEVSTVAEKPTPTEAEQRLMVPGLRAGYYLCFFGMHVLTADVMDKLGSQLADEGRADLSRALAGTAGHERYLAHELLGRRHDIDLHYGLLATQLALGLAGNDRDEVLTLITEALVQSHA